MRVAFFYPWGDYVASNARGMAAVRAMEAGVRRHGHNAEARRQNEGYAPCDVAVMWGCGKKRMPETSCRDDIVRAHGNRPFVRLERGYLCRERYESVGLNGLWGYADYNNAHSPPDRFHGLGIEIAAWQRESDGHVLVMGQVPWDTAVQHLNFGAWAEATCAALRALCPAREVRYRPHPMISKSPPLAEDLAGASCVVTLTSTSAVDALLAGIPPVALDPGSICWSLCGTTDLQHAAHPPTPPREAFLYDLAWAQWTHEEMARGEAWEHLFRS